MPCKAFPYGRADRVRNAPRRAWQATANGIVARDDTRKRNASQTCQGKATVQGFAVGMTEKLPNPKYPPTRMPPPGPHPKVSTAKQQALDLQKLLMDDARKKEVVPAVRAQIARAWVDLQEMRLRLAMKPAPKPIDVRELRKSRQKPATQGSGYSDPTA